MGKRPPPYQPAFWYIFCLSLFFLSVREGETSLPEGAPIFKMPPIPVVAQKPFGPLKKSPDVRVLKKEDVFPEEHSFTNIFEGVSVLNPTLSGGVGSLSLVYFPGSLSSGTLVLWEDLTLNDPSTPSGTFDFSSFGADVFDRIEIFQGNDPRFGTSGTGGTIKLETSFTEKSHHDSKVRVEGGSNGEAFLEGCSRILFQKGVLKVGGTGFRTDGALVGRAPLPRRRQGYGEASFDAQGKFQVGERTELSFFLKETDSQLQDLYSLQGRFLRESHFGAFTLKTKNLSGDTNQRLGFSNSLSLRRSSDGISTTKDRGNREEIRYALLHSRTPSFVLEGGGGLVEEGFYTGGFKKRRNLGYLFGSQTTQLFPNVDFTSGGRFEGASQGSSIFAFKTGLSYTREVFSTGIVGDVAQKRPTLYELYTSSSYVQGNPLLNPEQAYGLQVFALKKKIMPHTDLGLRLFERWFSRAIVGTLRSGKTFYEAAPLYRAQGFEPFWTMRISPRATFQGDATYTDIQKAKTASDVKILTPSFKVTGTLKYELSPSLKDEQEASLLFLKARYLSYKKTEIQGTSSFMVFDVGCDYCLSPRHKIYGGIKNLWNTSYRTQTDPNIKGEPFSFYTGIQVKF